MYNLRLVASSLLLFKFSVYQGKSGIALLTLRKNKEVTNEA